MGPGSELFKGRVDNTYIFRVMATALGLGKLEQPTEQAARQK
jgi:alkaline phosphatase